MSEVKRPFDKGWGKPHPKCKKTMDEYEEVLNKQGVLVPQKKDEVNFYDEIQARGECVEIKDVIKRYKLQLKDIPKVEIEEAINEVSNMPSDWTEAQNVIARTRNTFALLPKEERAMYNNNVEEFVKSFIEKDDKFKALERKILPEDERLRREAAEKKATPMTQATTTVAPTTTVTPTEVTNE